MASAVGQKRRSQGARTARLVTEDRLSVNCSLPSPLTFFVTPCSTDRPEADMQLNWFGILSNKTAETVRAKHMVKVERFVQLDSRFTGVHVRASALMGSDMFQRCLRCARGVELRQARIELPNRCRMNCSCCWSVCEHA